MNNEPIQSQSIKEQLSALMDGELSRDETRFLLRRLDADAQLASSWSSYQIASDVLKKRFATPMRADFSASVLQAIAVEQTIPARGGWLRWAGGGAIAAAVAVVALTSMRPLDDATPQPQVATAALNTSVTTGQSTLRAEQQIQNGVLPGFPALDYTRAASFEQYLDQRPAPYQYPMLMEVRGPLINSAPVEPKQ